MDNNNLTRARKCCLRKDNLCGKTSSCELCPYMKNIKELWIKFCDTPIQYSKTGCTTEEFNNFPIGTFRADIVDWFYKTFEVDIDALKKMTGRYDNKNSEDIPEYIKESNRIKKETCKSCMEQLNGILSNEQLEKFEDAFYSAVNGYILKRKDSANGNR